MSHFNSCLQYFCYCRRPIKVVCYLLYQDVSSVESVFSCACLSLCLSIHRGSLSDRSMGPITWPPHHLHLAHGYLGPPLDLFKFVHFGNSHPLPHLLASVRRPCLKYLVHLPLALVSQLSFESCTLSTAA